jgi:hypothetical protein
MSLVFKNPWVEIAKGWRETAEQSEEIIGEQDAQIKRLVKRLRREEDAKAAWRFVAKFAIACYIAVVIGDILNDY